MKRRTWFGWAVAFLLLPGVVLAEGPSEGFDYELVSPPIPSNTPDKVQVVELFWYGCPHCYAFEPHVLAWLKKKPENVEFVRIPAVFRNDRWELHARLFYALEVLGKQEELTPIIFDAIHKQRNPLKDRDAIAELLEEHGIARLDFEEAMDSFAVNLRANRAKDLSRRYGIDGVPAIVVDGRYRITTTLARTNDNMLTITDALVAEVAGNTP